MLQARLRIALLSLVLATTSIGGLRSSHASPAPQATLAPGIVSATVETVPVPHGSDAADDPAIWIHPSDPSQSTVIGTDKLGGLAVYDLAGNQLQYRPDGAINNVDLRYNFPLGDQTVALVTAGNRSNNSVAIYRVDSATRMLEDVAARTITAGLTVYGSCMYHSPASGNYYVFLDSKSGVVEQWELFATPDGRVDAQQVRSFDVGSQVEGCVADDEAQAFYIGEEAVGIWKYGAEPDAGAARTQLDSTGPNGHLTPTIEGLTIYYAGNGGGYLIASSQGNDSFVIYERNGTNAYVMTFTIAASGGIDGVSQTDGIDVTNFGLGGAFAQGMFIAQDGVNDVGNQNFKLVPWERIAGTLTPTLTIDTSWDPRKVGTSGPSSPTATPSPTVTPSSTATASPTATPSATPSSTATASPAVTPSATPSPTATPACAAAMLFGCTTARRTWVPLVHP